MPERLNVEALKLRLRRIALDKGHAATQVPLVFATVFKEDAEAVEQAITDLRDLRFLADGCPQHSSYRAKRKISTTCDICNAMWDARQRLNGGASNEV